MQNRFVQGCANNILWGNCLDPTLKNLAQELIELLKKQVGLQKFSLAFSAVQKDFSQRRAARKRHRAMQVRPDDSGKRKRSHSPRSET